MNRSNNSDGPNKLISVDAEFKGHQVTCAYDSSNDFLIGQFKDIELNALAPDEIRQHVPPIPVNTITLGASKSQNQQFLKSDLGFELALADIPILGKKIPFSLTLKNLSLLLNSLSKKVGQNTQKESRIQLLSNLEFDGRSTPLAIPIYEKVELVSQASNSHQLKSLNTKSEITQAHSRPTVWLDVNSQLGPLYIKRLGAQLNGDALKLLLDADLSMGPLTLILEGLAAQSPLDRLALEFDLSGIGIRYNKGQVAITGALLKTTNNNSSNKNAYSGLITIKTPKLNILATGAYETINGMPSLFCYGVSHFDIGIGPTFFRVTGLSAGFGYNRAIKVPEVNEIKTFPFVEAVVSEAGKSDPMPYLKRQLRYLPASAGNSFLAFGLKFNSFELIDSFALLLLQLGSKTDLDVIGVSKIAVPAKSSNPLAVAEIAYKAKYDFEKNNLKVEGVLTPESYLFSRDCKLTGGFALSTWFAGPHAGDFVYTMGGYHPAFKKPAHYPKVPRLAFNWPIASNLSIKGSLYYALVPGMLMAGGNLRASYEESFRVGFDIGIGGAELYGKVQAYFDAAADFIIAWQPFAYQADMRVRVGISALFKGSAWFGAWKFKIKKSVQKRFDLHLSAGLSIWGPDFSGKAHIDWDIISFDIPIGNSTKPASTPLTWSQFKNNFLSSANDEFCTVNITDGLITSQRESQVQQHGQIVNPKELKLSLDSVLPLSQVRTENSGVSHTGKAFSVKPMQLSTFNESKWEITVSKDGHDCINQFVISPIHKNMPEALWGDPSSTSLNSAQLVTNLLAGVEIKPTIPPLPDETVAQETRNFRFDVKVPKRAGLARWKKQLELDPDPQSGKIKPFMQTLLNDANQDNRNSILNILNLDKSHHNLTQLKKRLDTDFEHNYQANFNQAFLVCPAMVAA